MTTGNAIDWNLCVELANGKRDLAQELLEMLIKDLPSVKASITSLFTTNNLEELENRVHKLKGAACYVGVPNVKQIATDLETALKQNDASKIPLLTNQLENAIDQVLDHYEHINIA